MRVGVENVQCYQNTCWPLVVEEVAETVRLEIDVLSWLSFRCVVGLLNSGAVYHFWTDTSMSERDAGALARGTPMGPVPAVLGGGLRWDASCGGFRCESVKAL